MFCRLIILFLLICIIESTVFNGLRAANNFHEGHMVISPGLVYVVLRHNGETDISQNAYMRRGNLHTGALYPSSEMSSNKLLQICQYVRVNTASPNACIFKPAHNSLHIPHKYTALCSSPLSNYIITI